MPSLTLNDFTRLAAQTDASRLDTTFLKVRGDRLAETGRFGSFFTTQATRRATISAFAGTLRAQFGDRVADMINDDPALSARMREGRPLTARLVRDLTGRADSLARDLAGQAAREAVKEANLAVVRAFVDSDDPATGLDSAIAGFCGKKGVPADDDQAIAIVRKWVSNFLLDKADKNGFYPNSLSLTDLHNSIFAGRREYADFSSAKREALREHYPGPMRDRLCLADMGLGTKDIVTFDRCLERLGVMRQLQPEEDIRPETVYRALFETPPDGLDGKALLASIEERCAAEKWALMACVKNKIGCEGRLAAWGQSVPWEKLAALMLRPSVITRADMEKHRLAPGIAAGSSRDKVLDGLRGDPHRREPPLPVPTFSFRFDDARTEIIEVGEKTHFFDTVDAKTAVISTDDANKKEYLAGHDNSLARRLESVCREICGGEKAPEVQLTRAMACLTQEHLVFLKEIAPLAGAHFNEHSNVSVSLRRAEDGSGAILADFSSPQKLEDSLGRFQMSVSIAADGTERMTELKLDPPTAVGKQSAFEETLRDTVAGAFGNMLRARDAGEARAQLDALGDFMRNAVTANDAMTANDPDFVEKTADERASVMERFMLLGAMQLVNKGDPRPFAAALRRPGPFRDMLHSLAGENGAPAEAARTTMQWFMKGLAGVLPDEALRACDGSKIHERDLSLARQREIFGADVYTARGVEAASPELAALNDRLAISMSNMENYIYIEAEKYLREGSPRDHMHNGLSRLFSDDYKRGGVFVDGRYCRPDLGTSEADFIRLFPDARTAGLLSNLATQNLLGFLNAAVMNATRSRDLLFEAGFSTSVSIDDEIQNTRIETLDASRGRYRLSGFKSCSPLNPSIERYMYEVTIDVDLGAPGAPEASYPPPSVESVHVDMLFRGHEAGPDEA